MIFGGFNLFFNIFPILFIVMFCIIFAMFIMTFAKSISRWNQNKNAPLITTDAVVVAKRYRSSHHHANSNMHHSSFTYYYATFEFESKDRIELSMTGEDFGLLIEGDRGKLSFKGSEFVKFERI